MYRSSGQFVVFAFFLAAGFALGIVYRLANSFLPRKAKKYFGRLTVPLFDGVFGLISATTLFFCNLYINNGRFSVWVFLAVALGFFVSAKLKPIKKLPLK